MGFFTDPTVKTKKGIVERFGVFKSYATSGGHVCVLKDDDNIYSAWFGDFIEDDLGLTQAGDEVEIEFFPNQEDAMGLRLKSFTNFTLNQRLKRGRHA